MKLSWKQSAILLVALFNFGCGGVDTGLSAGPTSPGAPIAANTTEAVAGSPGAAEFLARNAAQGFASVEDRSVGQNRFLVFTSRGDLIPADTNGVRDVYLRDLRTGEMRLISVATNGTQGNGDSTQGSISADGRFVVFRSAATNLVTGDGNGVTDIFLHEIATGTTTRVSTATGGTEVSGASLTPAISANGRYVVFASSAPNLVATDSNGAQDIFFKDVTTDITTLVSSNSAQTDSANGASFDPAITAGTTTEGEFIAFSTEATDIVAGGLNGQRQVVRIERATPANRVLVSQSAGAVQADGPCYEPSLSNDGNTVAFFTLATNLGAVADGNGFFDVYTRNISGNTTTNQSVNTGGNPSDGHSGYPSLSADGSVVAFGSLATDLVAGDSNGRFDVFRRESGSTSLASQATDTTAGNSDSDLPGISLDGRYVAFRSAASTLWSKDSTTDDDIFVRDSLSPSTFWATISCIFSSSALSFTDGPTLTSTANVASTALLDLDGDGDLDIVASERFVAQLTVYTNTGAGSFSAPAVVSSPQTGPIRLIPADFDGDGDEDLLVGYENGAAMSVYLNDGSGTLTSPISLPLPSGSGNPFPSAGDIDGDGDLDVVVVSIGASGEAHVFRNNGSASFAATTLGFSFNSPVQTSLGDLDGDGDLDLAVTDLPSNVVRLYLNSDGLGTFTNGGSVSTSTPYALDLGDLNGDGVADLVVGSTSGTLGTRAFLNSGAGTFGAAVPLESQGAFGLFLTDIDFDGSLDIIRIPPSGGSTSILRNQGDGINYTTFNRTGTGYGVGVGDIDGNGTLDLVAPDVENSQITISLNTGGWPGLDTRTLVDVGPGSTGFGNDLGDIDGDGDLDIVSADRSHNLVHLLFNDGNGNYGAPVSLARAGGPYLAQLEDMDGDGDLDFVVATFSDHEAIVYLNAGNGTFTPGTPVALGGTQVRDMALADLDGDGDIDVAVAQSGGNLTSILLNDGTGALTLSSSPNTGNYPEGVALGDLNGDNIPDLAVANSFGGSSVTVRFNDGMGGFTGSAAVTMPTGTLSQKVALGDLDGDGDLDIAVTGSNSSTNPLNIFLNQGGGTFAPRQDYPAGVLATGLELGDVDGDGDLDAAIGDTNGGNVLVLLNNGSGVFGPPRAFTGGSGIGDVDLGDLDGDGDLDFVSAIQNATDLGITKNLACP